MTRRTIGTSITSVLAAALLAAGSVQGAPVTWIGGNVDWVDGGAATNWSPNDEPDSNDEAIFNTANTVDLGSNNAVNGLTMSGGIDLDMNDFDLTVDGLVTVGGAGTNLFIGGAAGSIDADDVTINASGVIELRGGTLTMDEEVGTSLIDINAGGTLQGNGVVFFADVPGVATNVLVNDGTITALSRGVTIFSPPPVGTLTIDFGSGIHRADLDGTGEAGVVNVNRNQTLDLDIALSEAFNGTMNLSHNSTFDSLSGWTLGAGGSIVADNGFVDGGIFDDILPATSFIDGGPFTQTGGTINVADTDGTLQLDVDFTMTGGSFTNSGTAIFNGVTNITTAAGYDPSSVDAQTIINGNFTINDAAADFNWDGDGAADTTINNGSLVSITADQIDNGDNIFGGTITLNDGSDLGVNVTGTSWSINGALVKNDAGLSAVFGDRVVINGQLSVNAGTLEMAPVTTTVTTNINVAGTLELGSASELMGGTFAGTGLLRMVGTSTVSADTTISVATFDWDGFGVGTNHTINSFATLTLNSPNFNTDGDMDDPITLAGSDSTLSVNGVTQWTMNQAINANNAGVGTATIGGSARMILNGASAVFNVNGDTDVNAPITFGTNSVTSIDAGFTLDVGVVNATYAGGTISGAGTYSPGSTNTVTADSTINVATLDFDSGTWTVQPGANLTVNVTDYDTTATNAFDGVMTINDGEIDVLTGDAFFVMDGTINMQTTFGNDAVWDGEPIHIGNDAGSLDANVNVTGAGDGVFATNSGLTFNSDADVDIAAGAALRFLSGTPVTFNSVNGANNAEFTGAGRIEFSGNVFVNEATTFNMTGGTVDFDSTDTTGATINVDAPFVINAASVLNYGNANTMGGPDTIDVNNSVGTGILTVSLDSPAAEWTINGPGILNLVNDNTGATLLAGSDVNINGTLNVTGDVRTEARLDIAGLVAINTAAQPLRLAGGTTNDPNTLAGGTISGLGLLGADTGKALHGFGTINTAVDFDATSNLRADNGTLTVNGAILDVNIIGTNDADGVLNVPAAWNTNVAAAVSLLGGTLQGGAITNDTSNGIQGFGAVTSRVINNTQILGGNGGGTLIFQTAGNDNDWDGAAGAGELIASAGAVLELRDDAFFGFTGTVSALPGGRVFTNGFALDFNPGSTLSLDNGTFESTNSTDIGGTVTVAAGMPSTIKVENNRFLSFETGSSTTLNGNMQLQNNNIIIEQGATFAGGGALVIPDGSHVVGENLANIGVLVDMQGAFRPGNSNGIGRVDLFDYQQSDTGELFVELTGTALNAFDRLVASGDVALHGYLNIDIDEVSPGVPFVPALGQTFNIVTGNTVTGTFGTVDVSGMPAGLAFHVEYLGNVVQLQVVTKPIFSADFDEDGDVDSTDLTIWRGAFNLNQLGDADGDNDSDGADFLLWQQQVGSKPAVAVVASVPEPTAAALLALGTLAWIGATRSERRSRPRT